MSHSSLTKLIPDLNKPAHHGSTPMNCNDDNFINVTNPYLNSSSENIINHKII
jgi:hypothetical protein